MNPRYDNDPRCYKCAYSNEINYPGKLVCYESENRVEGQAGAIEVKPNDVCRLFRRRKDD
jgi:hypothetical protein